MTAAGAPFVCSRSSSRVLWECGGGGASPRRSTAPCRSASKRRGARDRFVAAVKRARHGCGCCPSSRSTRRSRSSPDGLGAARLLQLIQLQHLDPQGRLLLGFFFAHLLRLLAADLL